MDTKSQAAKAEQLRKLHHGPRILVLANAWDVASARVMEELGYPAIATTSAGVAAALGYPDGQRIPREEMLEVVGRIARAVRVPVTADVEAGYGTTARWWTLRFKRKKFERFAMYLRRWGFLWWSTRARIFT